MPCFLVGIHYGFVMARAARPKRGIQLSLYIEDIQRMEDLAAQRRVPVSKSEVVSMALKLLWESMGIPDERPAYPSGHPTK